MKAYKTRLFRQISPLSSSHRAPSEIRQEWVPNDPVGTKMARRELLSDTQIKKARAVEHPYKLNDGGGLYLLVHPRGSKYWRYRYKVAGTRVDGGSLRAALDARRARGGGVPALIKKRRREAQSEQRTTGSLPNSRVFESTAPLDGRNCRLSAGKELRLERQNDRERALGALHGKPGRYKVDAVVFRAGRTQPVPHVGHVHSIGR
jgi:hypothetical protein